MMNSLRNNNKYFFTLIEVVISLGILTLVAFGAAALMAQAKVRSIKAERDLIETHIFGQAMEYFLLDMEAKEIPEEYFPYPDYSVERDFERVDDLPKDMEPDRENWSLVRMTVELRYQGTVVRSITVECIADSEVLLK